MRDWADVRADVLARLDLKAVAEICGVKVRREGVGWKSACPFHADKSPSFVLGGRKGMEHRGHCFGCGWDGDVFSFWEELKGCDFKTALGDLASLAGVPMGDGVVWSKPDVPRVRSVERRPACERPENEMPSLPPLRHLRREECEMVAVSRGLDVEAVWLAARTFKRMAFSEWPLYRAAGGEWLPRSVGTWGSWCAIDETRAVAEFRRLDNGRYPRQDGGEIKSWSTAGKAWPLGAAAMNGRPCVMLVEGGPDMLAGYHFLRRFGMLDRVAVVCMLGAGNRMREDSLGFFKGKRVRIMVDADPLKDALKPSMRKLPGMEAAARWGGQMREAGAVVETFCLGPIYAPVALREWADTEGPAWSGAVPVVADGLRLPNGELVKDLNDLALCGPNVLELRDVREAFLTWDF